MFPRVARFRSVADLRQHLATIDAPIPLEDSSLSAARPPSRYLNPVP